MDGYNKICRACLGCCPQEYYSLNHGTPSYQFKLQECIPFMNFKMILDPIICTTCATMLDRSYQLLIVARNVETRLGHYMKECSYTGACYIMAYKPVNSLLECLSYRTVVDNAFNFRMIVATVVKAEVKEIEQSAVNTIKSEEIDRDYDESVMPNIDLMCTSLLTTDYEQTRYIPPNTSLPEIDHSTNKTIISNTRKDHLNSILSPAAVPDLVTTKRVKLFVQEATVEKATPSKIIAPPTYIPSPHRVMPPLSFISNEVRGRSVKSPILRECPICHQSFRSLVTHMRVHANNILCYTDTIRRINAHCPLTSAASTSKCVQCGYDYKKSDGHKCPFSCYIRLERSRSLDDMAKSFNRPQLLEHGKYINQRKNFLLPHNNHDVGNTKHITNKTLNNNAPLIVDNSYDINNSNCNRLINDTIASDSSTLSGLSVYNEECDTELSVVRGTLFRCHDCQLRFDNNLQLRRHLCLSHKITIGLNKSRNNSLDSTSDSYSNIFDEHSYAWLKSIQCWNCSHSFSTREAWLRHDYMQHKSFFVICYICFRSYKHTQIISHITNTHSLPMEEKSFYRMVTSQTQTEVKRNDWRNCGVLVDETYSRMSRFIMFEYQLTHCPLCQKPCGNTSVLMRHLMLNKCTKSSCLLCHTELHSSLHLLDHLMTYQHRKQIINANGIVNEKHLCCPVCDAVFAIGGAFVNHCCFDKNNPHVVYKRKMGLWACSECFIMSPFGITAKLQHILSAIHLKRRLNRLINSTNIKKDLSCHLCPKIEAYTSKINLIEHLKCFHIENQSVLCPLCRYMVLTPDNFTSHLRTVHTDFLSSQDGNNSSSITNTSAEDCNDEFKCLLCDRNHWTLNSFWKTCGQGHKDLTFTLDRILKYLDLFNVEKWLHFNGGWYNCDCGRMIQTNSDLYYHYRGFKGDLEFAHCCSFWACCVECGVLISPKNKLEEHKQREHRRIEHNTPPITDKNKLLEIHSRESTENKEMLLGKRKRRKTQLYLEVEESGGLLAMDKKVRLEIETSRKQRSRKLHSSRNKFTAINLADVDKINSSIMQPVVQLEELNQSMLAHHREVDSSFSQEECEDVSGRNIKTGTLAKFKKTNNYLHMTEAIERVVAKSNANNDSIELNDDDDVDDDDDHSSSSSSSELLTLVHPHEIKKLTFFNDQAELPPWDFYKNYQEPEIQIPELLPVPFIESKDEELNIVLNMDDATLNVENLSFPKEVLLEGVLENEIDINFIETLVKSEEDMSNFNNLGTEVLKKDSYINLDSKQMELYSMSDFNDSNEVYPSTSGCVSKVDEPATTYENLANDKYTPPLHGLTNALDIAKAFVIALDIALPSSKSGTYAETTDATVNSITNSNKKAMKMIYKCNICHMLTASKLELRLHSCRLSKIAIVQCLFCHRDFLNDAKLRSHMKCEHNYSDTSTGRVNEQPQFHDDQYKSNVRDGQVVSVMSYSGKMRLVQQMDGQVQQTLVQQLRKNITCSLCREICENMDVLIAHMKANHFQSICIHCDDKFANTESLNRHLDDCVQALRNQDLNRIIFQTASQFEHNANTAELIRNDASENYGDNSQSSQTVVQNPTTSVDTNVIQCNIFQCLDCNLLLPGFFVAKEHFNNLHDDAAGHVYKCQKCDSFAVDRELMQEHKKLHKDGLLKCIVCDNEFKYIGDYKYHYEQHKMVACPYCPRLFLDLEELHTHSCQA